MPTVAAITVTDATSLDAGKIGAILSEHVDLTDWHPRVHSRAEEIHFASRMIALGWVRVARIDSAMVGFLARDRHDIIALFIHSGAQRQGVGSVLVQDAKQSKAHLTAWSYVQNTQARSFYRSEGFIEDQRTDGSQNDLKLPDIKYIWNYSM